MKSTVNIETDLVCHCKAISYADLAAIFANRPDVDFAHLYDEYGIGSQCASCEYEVKALVDDHLAQLGVVNEVHRPCAGRPQWRAPAKKTWLRRWLGSWTGPRKVNYLTGVFALRRRSDSLDTHLVISNLNLPENDFNPNGDAVAFVARLYDEAGRPCGTSSIRRLRAGSSAEYPLEDLFPAVRGDVVGGLYVDFFDLEMTSSLRPYGVLVSSGPEGARARCHFHDKFARFTEPGFYQNTSPFVPGQTCWLAVSNCLDQRWTSRYVLRSRGKSWEGGMALGPMESKWMRLEDLFPPGSLPLGELDPGLLYFESPQHVMMYFFWQDDSTGSWVAQHH